MTANNRGPQLAALGGVFIFLTWLFVGLRIYVKTFLSKNWGSDDALLVAALAIFTTYCGLALEGITKGTGRHLDQIPPADIPKGLYYWWLCELLYTASTVLVRLSIAVFLLRICVKPIHKYIIYWTVTFVCTFSTFYFFLILFQCSPVSYFWGQYEGKKGQCINPAWVPDASIAHSAVSFTADVILSTVPVLLIHPLQMNFRTKVSIGGLLSLGLLAGIATMIRVPYIKVLSLTDDFLFATTDVAVWSTVESGLGIIACGGATLRPLFKKFYGLTSSKNATAPTGGRSRMGYMRGNDDGGVLELRPKNNQSMKNSSQVGVTTIRSPFAEEGERDSVGEWSKTGIKVKKTVDVQTSQHDGEGWISDASSMGGGSARDQFPGVDRKERDMV